MKKFKKLSKQFENSKGVALMYHRISSDFPDPWNLNVSETNFRDHLNLFKTKYNVLPLAEFNELRKSGCLPDRALAITFDDGYADNAQLAAPMMHEVGLPATFFICTGTLGLESGMWWDDLAQIVFREYFSSSTEKLEYENKVKELFCIPTTNEESNNHNTASFPIGNMQHTSANSLYMQLWQKLQPLPAIKQQHQIEQYIKQINFKMIKMYPMMRDSDVRNLSKNSLFEIGAHTRNHIQLPAHEIDLQTSEIHENIQHLEKLTGKRISSLSYPFGSYNNDTLEVAKQKKFSIACTTVPEVATRIDDTLLLPRVTVNDVSGDSLHAYIDNYFSMNF